MAPRRLQWTAILPLRVPGPQPGFELTRDPCNSCGGIPAKFRGPSHPVPSSRCRDASRRSPKSPACTPLRSMPNHPEVPARPAIPAQSPSHPTDRFITHFCRQRFVTRSNYPQDHQIICALLLTFCLILVNFVLSFRLNSIRESKEWPLSESTERRSCCLAPRVLILH
jgi:hypothetical protein